MGKRLIASRNPRRMPTSVSYLSFTVRLLSPTDMISDNTPILSRSISIPKDLKNLSTESFTSGIVESVLDGLNFKSKVTAHSVPTEQYPQRTTILIKLI